MEVPEQLTRAAGDVHAMGNPHFMVDPIIAKAVAAHIAEAHFRGRSPARGRYQAKAKEVRGHDQRQAPGVGRKIAALQRPKPCRISRFMGLLRASFWVQHQHLSRAKTGYPAVTLASRGGDRADEGAEDQGHHCRALPQPEDRGKGGAIDRCQGGRFRASPPFSCRNTNSYVKLIDALVNNLAAALK